MSKVLQHLLKAVLFLYPLFSSAQVTLYRNPPQVDGITPEFIYQNHLYCFSSYTSSKDHLAKFSGDSVALLSNPDNLYNYEDYTGAGPFVYSFSNKMYLRCNNALYKRQLAELDGDSIHLIPNLSAADNGVYGYPVYYNGRLYFTYETNRVWYLAYYDGTGIHLVPNPDNGYGVFFPTVYKNELCFKYFKQNQAEVLGSYSGFLNTGISLKENPTPAVGGGSGVGGNFFILNDNLYFRYGGRKQIGKYDGTSVTLTDSLAGVMIDFTNPIYYDGKIYLQDYLAPDAYTFYNAHLLSFDGSRLQKIGTPFEGRLDPSNKIIYKGKLCFGLSLNQVTYNDTGYLAQYDGNSVTTVPNVPGNGIYPYPIQSFTALVGAAVYNDKLYFGYMDGDVSLASFDGSRTDTITASPALTTPLMVFDNKLFYSSFGQLASYNDEAVLPVSLLHFDARQAGENALITWQTANNSNTASFIIQRSTDGISFTPLDKVFATGSPYIYYDKTIQSLDAKTVYYRLQIMDKDGGTGYSAIASVPLLHQLRFTISPNPARSKITVQGYELSSVKIYDDNGRLLVSKQHLLSGNITLSVNHLRKGVYIVSIEDSRGYKETKKLVIE